MELFGQRTVELFGSGALRHWAEYFVVVGTDENKAKLFTDSAQEEKSNDSKGNNSPRSQKKIPIVLTRIPSKDVQGYPLPDQVPMVR